MELSEKIHQARRGLKMRQGQLAKTVEMSQAALSRIEAGKSQYIRPNTLAKLAKALNVSVDYLVGS
ncbi:helix-turn-helix transcriptional regulator [candidate division TA06 bacterium]|nr:helix-turn-helix transcriptional regulator [candidate division TA06 bacterium]